MPRSPRKSRTSSRARPRWKSARSELGMAQGETFYRVIEGRR